MKQKKWGWFILILLAIAVSIHIFSNNQQRVENLFSLGVYPFFSRIQRYIFGWLPFSAGDILYAILILWLLWKAVKIAKLIFKKQVTWQSFYAIMYKTSVIVLCIYILFNISWGINYNRVGIAEQLGLNMHQYNPQDLKMINELLVKKVNETKLLFTASHQKYPGKKQLFVKVQEAYRNAETEYPFLKYNPVSLKPSLWSWLGNYIGFTGYYNPFTGEAQVNTLVPQFLQPFTSCHEVAHQLGYAKEMEANFVGYLAATASPDPLLNYSAYLDLFMYSNRNLFDTDSIAAINYKKQLVPEVVADLEEWKQFYKNHQSPLDPLFRWLYGYYLKQNQQPQGLLSYDEVTGFIIEYYKKFGKI